MVLPKHQQTTAAKEEKKEETTRAVGTVKGPAAPGPVDVVVVAGGITLSVSKEHSDKGDEEDDRVVFDKVQQTWGSSAGAGSDFFHKYRKRRAHELERLEQMDKDWDEKCEHREFQTKRAEGFAEAEAKTAKNREKRQKKKQNKEQAKQAKNAGNCSVNMYSSDGSFLELAAKELSATEGGETEQVTAKAMQKNENLVIRDHDD